MKQLETTPPVVKQARAASKSGEADRIRTELAAEGILLEDRPDGTTTWWKD